MNPELQQELVKWLREMHGVAEKSATFAIDQMPKVAAEMVSLGRVESTVGLIAALVMLAVGVTMAYGSCRWDWKKLVGSPASYDDGEGCKFACGFTSIFVIGFGLIGTVACFDWAMTAWFAPRLYVLRQLAGLLH